MSERFVTPAKLPSQHEAELLTILIEECSEVQQRATKMLRFGRDEVQPGHTATNAERLSLEVGDLQEMVTRLLAVGLLNQGFIDAGISQKRKQLLKFMQTEKSP